MRRPARALCSNLKSAWGTISAGFTLEGNVDGTTMSALSANTTSHVYYRIQKTSGITRATATLREFEFKFYNN